MTRVSIKGHHARQSGKVDLPAVVTFTVYTPGREFTHETFFNLEPPVAREWARQLEIAATEAEIPKPQGSTERKGGGQ